MTFQIEALEGAQFEHYFQMSEAELRAQGARRVTATTDVGFPCRVSLRDAEAGDVLVLVNYEHLPVASPYRSRHAIYVREGAVQARPDVGEVPDVLSGRLLAVRGLDAQDMIVAAEVVEGAELGPVLDAVFANPAVRYVQMYNAKRGCFAATARRAKGRQS